MAPLIKAFQLNPGSQVKICVTGQHREMLDQVLDFFDIQPDYDLNLMSPNQTLYDITARALLGLKGILSDFRPENLFVQGDTTTAFVGALAGFYEKINISHIEAGLRSGNKYSPFPEEGNRIVAGHLATHHFAPTEKAVKNLRKEGITNNVFKVGNTVIDALFLGLKIIDKAGEQRFYDRFDMLDFSKSIVLVTGHRRESFGRPFENLCGAIKQLATRYPELQIIYPVHLNPNVQRPVKEILADLSNVHLIDPLPYPYLIWLVNKSFFVLTDSGGIQEEAPSLGKPVLVMREVTERTEGVEAGTAKLVGTDPEKIVTESELLLNNNDHYSMMSNAVNPYGNGTTSRQIVEIFNKALQA